MQFFLTVNLCVRQDFCFVRKQFLISHAVWLWSCKYLLREGKGFEKWLWQEIGSTCGCCESCGGTSTFREVLAAWRKSRLLKEDKEISCPSSYWLFLFIYFSGISAQLHWSPGCVGFFGNRTAPCSFQRLRREGIVQGSGRMKIRRPSSFLNGSALLMLSKNLLQSKTLTWQHLSAHKFLQYLDANAVR